MIVPFIYLDVEIRIKTENINVPDYCGHLGTVSRHRSSAMAALSSSCSDLSLGSPDRTTRNSWLKPDYNYYY